MSILTEVCLYKSISSLTYMEIILLNIVNNINVALNYFKINLKTLGN